MVPVGIGGGGLDKNDAVGEAVAIAGGEVKAARTVGVELIVAVGDPVGCMIGLTVRGVVGRTEGVEVIELVWDIGGAEGDDVGFTMGEAVGAVGVTVGDMDGLAVGDVVGVIVGGMDGLPVGDIVGELVGVFVQTSALVKGFTLVQELGIYPGERP